MWRQFRSKCTLKAAHFENAIPCVIFHLVLHQLKNPSISFLFDVPLEIPRCLKGKTIHSLLRMRAPSLMGYMDQKLEPSIGSPHERKSAENLFDRFNHFLRQCPWRKTPCLERI